MVGGRKREGHRGLGVGGRHRGGPGVDIRKENLMGVGRRVVFRRESPMGVRRKGVCRREGALEEGLGRREDVRRESLMGVRHREGPRSGDGRRGSLRGGGRRGVFRTAVCRRSRGVVRSRTL